MKVCQITTNPKTNIFGCGSNPSSPLDSSTAQALKWPTPENSNNFPYSMHICERPNVAGLVDNQAIAIYPQGSERKKKCLTHNSYESMSK